MQTSWIFTLKYFAIYLIRAKILSYVGTMHLSNWGNLTLIKYYYIKYTVQFRLLHLSLTYFCDTLFFLLQGPIQDYSWHLLSWYCLFGNPLFWKSFSVFVFHNIDVFKKIASSSVECLSIWIVWFFFSAVDSGYAFLQEH